MGILRLWLRAYYDYGYGCTTTMATGVLQLRLRANVRAYYANFFTVYTVAVFNLGQIHQPGSTRELGDAVHMAGLADHNASRPEAILIPET